MFLLDALNKAVKEVPNIAKCLEINIERASWDEERTRYAMAIVRQLQKPLLEQHSNILAYGISFESLKLELSQSEVEKISKERNMCEISEYFEGIITDINALSRDIRLSYGGHDPSGDICKIEISWYI